MTYDEIIGNPTLNNVVESTNELFNSEVYACDHFHSQSWLLTMMSVLSDSLYGRDIYQPPTHSEFEAACTPTFLVASALDVTCSKGCFTSHG